MKSRKKYKNEFVELLGDMEKIINALDQKTIYDVHSDVAPSLNITKSLDEVEELRECYLDICTLVTILFKDLSERKKNKEFKKLIESTLLK